MKITMESQFQFQTGAIKSLGYRLTFGYPQCRMFQFQTGAIKSGKIF